MTEVDLIYKNQHGGLLVIMPHALNRMLAHRQLDRYSNEAAGVLIGERRGPHLVVHEISEPGPGDIRHRCFVDRRGAHHQIAVDEAFKASSGTLQYLGEWHTHPEDVPSPSATDLGTWQQHLNAEDEQMVLVIVGRKEFWTAIKKSRTIIPLVKS